MKKVLFIMLIIVSVVACESESRLASIEMIQSVDAYVGNSIVLEVSHTPANAMVPAYRFKTNNQFVASVTEQGTVVCNHVGTCTIQVATADTRFSTTCIVNVKPNNALYTEPVLDFKTTKAAIKLKETDKAIVYETATMLIYQGIENPVQQVAYQFDETRKLVTAVVKLSTDASSELDSFMSECYNRYQAAGNNDLPVWRGNDTEVVVKAVNNTCFVVYNPFSGSSTCTSALNTIEMLQSVK
ncbi:MAG: Ig-like domain-containing protein [Bacteroidales bacterium]|jgi:hypothetical protein|nr:Ig-like domain-containing protein [Bacteroidales bacterium]